MFSDFSPAVMPTARPSTRTAATASTVSGLLLIARSFSRESRRYTRRRALTQLSGGFPVTDILYQPRLAVSKRSHGDSGWRPPAGRQSYGLPPLRSVMYTDPARRRMASRNA